MTLYYTLQEQQRFSVTHIHKYACDYLLDWFATIDSNAGLSNLLNQLSESFRYFSTSLLENFLPSDCFTDLSLLDSMPIITYSGKRNGKVVKV